MAPSKDPENLRLVIKLVGTMGNLNFTRKKTGESALEWTLSHGYGTCRPRSRVPLRGTHSWHLGRTIFRCAGCAHFRMSGIPGSQLTKCQEHDPLGMTSENNHFQKPMERMGYVPGWDHLRDIAHRQRTCPRSP